ncbi:MAG: D-alanyl-D-alanine carboxypeptidase family protein [Thermoanaerobacteraceae bacterium]
MRRFFSAYLIIIIILNLILPNYVYAKDNAPEIVGPTAVLIDFTSGQVLYDKNMNQKMYPASTTKILTAILAIENGKLDDIVTASDNVTKVDGNSIFLSPGEKMTLRDLLYALLLESANDAAIAIAEHIGGSVENFARMMNQKAKEIGAKNSNFVNPNGLPDQNHYSTPYDMALIGRYAMENKEFSKIVSTLHYTIPPTNKMDKERDLWQSNRLLKPSSYHYDGADGIKTGYTTIAQQVLVASAVRNNHRLISVIMGDTGTNIWTDTIKLLDYGFNNFDLIKLNNQNELITYATIGKSQFKLPLTAKNDFYYEIPKNEKDNIKSEIILNKNLKAPISKGNVLGNIVYKLNGKEIGSVELVAKESVYKNIWGTYYNESKTQVIKNNHIKFINLLFGFVLILIAFVLLKKRRFKKKKNYIFSKY